MLHETGKRIEGFFSPGRKRGVVSLYVNSRRNESRHAPPPQYQPGRFVSENVWISRCRRRRRTSCDRPSRFWRMVANDRLRVPPFRWRYAQSRFVEASAIEIKILLKNRRDLSAGSVKIQDDMRQSRVGVHVRNLLAIRTTTPLQIGATPRSQSASAARRRERRRR
jgi:hypothetical protein